MNISLKLLPQADIQCINSSAVRWRAFIFYIYTDKLDFSPLKSSRSSLESLKKIDETKAIPSCSPKSMYRLAEKVERSSYCSMHLHIPMETCIVWSTPPTGTRACWYSIPYLCTEYRARSDDQIHVQVRIVAVTFMSSDT